MVKKVVKIRNFDCETLTPGTGKFETGAVVKNLKGMSGVEGGKGTSYQWKEKGQYSKGKQCSFRHDAQDRAQKPEHTTATPSESCRGREVSGSKGNHGSILRQPCRFFLRGTCTRTSCEYWHPPECQSYKTETGCKAGDKCQFPPHKVDEQPNKKAKERLLFTHKKRKRRQKCSGYCEHRITVELRLARLGSIGFSKRRTVPVKTRCKDVLGPI